MLHRLRALPWQWLLAPAYPALANLTMNAFYRSLSIEANLLGRVSGCLLGSSVAAITLVAAYIVLASKRPTALGIPFGVVAYLYYYVYHPKVPAYELLVVTLQSPASLLNMVLLIGTPFVCALGVSHFGSCARTKL